MSIEVKTMARYNVAAHKRSVTLTLNEDLVAQACAVTDNLSTVVEALLADYIAKEQRRRTAETDVVRETVATWNRFADERGSFADGHSTL
jgi:post-segregation antitoxin (ccd killing protein)